jgi:S-adenosylmethionine/arginine decarboxylase-like enzyme
LNEINLIANCQKYTKISVPIKCDNGYYYNYSERNCFICEAVKYCQNNLIYNCRKGTFSPEGSSRCVLCLEEHIQIKKVHLICDKYPVR